MSASRVKKDLDMMGMINPETVHYGMWDGSSIVISAYMDTLIM